MRRNTEKGLTLVELIITIAVTGIIAGAATALLSVCLDAHAYGNSRSALHQEGLTAMERMTSGVRNCTFLNVPNGNCPVRGYLVFSGTVNDDGDYYFGDPLFPRIDEDVDNDMNADSADGLADFDDDGDGSTDEAGVSNDDEEGLLGEDPLNGLDDDGDGSVDEDLDDDMNGDGQPGVLGWDDDGDGLIDETGGFGADEDDDEDGVLNEDPTNEVLYWATGNELREKHHWSGDEVILSTRATDLTVTYEPPDATHAPRVLISLTLTGDDGESITFAEYAYPRNVVQKTGKKVR